MKVLGSVSLAALVAAVSGACSTRVGERGIDPIDPGGDDGGTTMLPDGGGLPDRPDPGPSSNCDSRAQWIYVVDMNRALVRYEPDSGALTRIGTLNCPAEGGATPFSMAVDRSAVAWVLYSNGDLFRVSTTDASCTATGFARSQSGLEIFGMGFASDGVGSEAETLYVAGGSQSGIGSRDSQFAVLHTDSLLVETRGGRLPGSPELTGNGNGELWAFSPGTFGPGSVLQVDKSAGSVLQTFPLNSIDTVGTSAWAFAFWGGGYYVFVQGLFDMSSSIYRFDPSTGTATGVASDTGYTIVGAGVSTCAPVTIS